MKNDTRTVLVSLPDFEIIIEKYLVHISPSFVPEQQKFAAGCLAMADLLLPAALHS